MVETHRVCDNIKCPGENKTRQCAVRLGGVKIKSPLNAKTRAGIKMQIHECYLKRFSLYLDQKTIYLKALNKSGPLICRTDN